MTNQENKRQEYQSPPGRVWSFLTRRKGGQRFDITDTITYLYLIVGAIVMFGPILWLIMSSFKDESLINSPNPTFLPYRQVREEVEGFDKPLALYDVTFKDSFLGGAELVATDLRASNGVVHAIDQVLVPPNVEAQLASLSAGDPSRLPTSTEPIPLEATGNLLETVRAEADLTMMAQILEQANLDTILTGEKRYTVLAPTNDALEAFINQYGDETVAALLADQDLLHELLFYHILDDRYLLVNMYRLENSQAPTLHHLRALFPVLVQRDFLPLSPTLQFAMGLIAPTDMVTLGEEAWLSFSLKDAETRRLAQVGSPTGANYTMVDPSDPEAGTFSVFSYFTTSGDRSTDFEPVREVYFNYKNYTEGLEAFDFWIYARNSVIVTTVATIVTLVVNSMAAFGLSKYRFAGRDAIFLVIISTLMVPVSVILIPAFLVISEVGWVNNLWGLIIPGAATPTGVFLLRQYMLTIPDELLDAARIDGASEWRIYWQIILPLARPALAVLAIFSVMWRWNDFLWPLVVVSQNEKFTLPVGLNAFQGALDVQWHYILAMTVLTLLPITIVFAILQRYITSGIATTGMKG